MKNSSRARRKVLQIESSRMDEVMDVERYARLVAQILQRSAEGDRSKTAA